jgi:hypothetical protein
MIRSRVVVTIAAMLSTLLGVGVSSATGSAPEAPPYVGVPGGKLTAAEEQAMQAVVNEHLRYSVGAQQISINQIAYANGSVIMTLPLPGEQRARAITEPMTPPGVPNCAFKHVCLWSDTNFNGTRIDRVVCNGMKYFVLPAPFNVSIGSIHNNQTPGTQTMVLDSDLRVLHANLAPSTINDTGVGARYGARFWQICP